MFIERELGSNSNSQLNSAINYNTRNLTENNSILSLALRQCVEMKGEPKPCQ